MAKDELRTTYRASDEPKRRIAVAPADHDPRTRSLWDAWGGNLWPRSATDADLGDPGQTSRLNCRAWPARPATREIVAAYAGRDLCFVRSRYENRVGNARRDGESRCVPVAETLYFSSGADTRTALAIHDETASVDVYRWLRHTSLVFISICP